LLTLHVAIAVNHFWFQLLTRLEDELCRKSLVLHNIESTRPAASLMYIIDSVDSICRDSADTQYMLIQTNFSKSAKQLTYKPL